MTMPRGLIDSEDLLERHLQDPKFREHWVRTALGRAVGLTVLRYRSEHGLSLRALARQLGMTHPRVAQLEAGDHNPSIETLQRLARQLGMEFQISVLGDGEVVLKVAAAAAA